MPKASQFSKYSGNHDDDTNQLPDDKKLEFDRKYRFVVGLKGTNALLRLIVAFSVF